MTVFKYLVKTPGDSVEGSLEHVGAKDSQITTNQKN